jgi:hypothetical protein
MNMFQGQSLEDCARAGWMLKPFRMSQGKDMMTEAVLDHAEGLDRIVFTRDDDFLRIAAERQRDGCYFRGIIYAHQLRTSHRQCIEDLELIAVAGSPDEFENRVYHLPLRA